MIPDALLHHLQAHQQQHVLHFWDELSAEQQGLLVRQLGEIDLPRLAVLTRAGDATGEPPAQKALRAVAPARVVRVAAQTDDDRHARNAARQAGEAALREGRVGVILVAGGEGTRLGFPHPKGEFPIGEVSGKSLFQLLAEQVVARSRRAGARIPYYVMTSRATHEATVAFFETHGCFGLRRSDVHFFQQGNMPAVDRNTGRLLLASKHELALNPDGHGGLLVALDQAQLFEDMRRRGIDFLYYHQVDNPLARVCDPEFLGFHIQTCSEVSTKVVAKLSPEEKMGVLVDVDGRAQIIEYSDLPADLAARRDARDQTIFWAGSTAIHVFNRSFFERLRAQRVELPFHRAVKKVPALDETGRLVEPASENAVKFERFIFDVLPLAERSLAVEARRDEEFCPLKNRSGDFSPEHVRASMSRRHAEWLAQAGLPARDGVPVEISPLYALDAEELSRKLDRTRDFTGPIYLEE